MLEKLKKIKSINVEKIANIFKADIETIDIILCCLVMNFILIGISMFNKIHIVNIIGMGIYIFYLIKKDKKFNFLNCLILLLESKFLVENFWYATHIEFNIYVLKIQPIILIIVLIKTLMDNEVKKLYKDKVIIGIILFIIFGIIRDIIGHANLNDMISSIYVYGGAIVFYIYTSTNKFNYELFYKIILILQLPLVLFEFFIYKDQDQITGIFGLHATNWSMIFLAFSIYYTFVIYLEKKINYKIFLGTLTYCFGLFMINESKMAFFVIPACLFIIILISKIDIKKKIAIAMTIVMLALIGMMGIIKIYPSFKNILFNPKNAMNYVFNEKSGAYHYNRIENIENTNNLILENLGEKLFGKGIGQAIPDREFNIEMYNRGRWYNGTKNSVIYERFGEWGYVQSSFNIMWIEMGAIGIILYIIFILTLLSRAITLVRETNETKERALGIGFIAYIIGWIFMYFYSEVFYTFNSNMLFFILAGIVTYKYKNLKKIGSEQNATEASKCYSTFI